MGGEWVGWVGRMSVLEGCEWIGMGEEKSNHYIIFVTFNSSVRETIVPIKTIKLIASVQN